MYERILFVVFFGRRLLICNCLMVIFYFCFVCKKWFYVFVVFVLMVYFWCFIKRNVFFICRFVCFFICWCEVILNLVEDKVVIEFIGRYNYMIREIVEIFIINIMWMVNNKNGFKFCCFYFNFLCIKSGFYFFVDLYDYYFGLWW